MRRIRRPNREIVFSFDSFLDLVANVVGIIIRLILVVWVGARSYEIIISQPESPALPPLENLAKEGSKTEWQQKSQSEEQAIEELERQLAAVQKELLAQIRQQKELRGQQEKTKRSTLALANKAQSLEEEQSAVDARHQRLSKAEEAVEASVLILRNKLLDLQKRMAKMKPLPVKESVLRYQVPVAEIVQSEELHFECREGRVTFLDVAALLREIRNQLPFHARQLRTQWSIEGRTAPVGAFRFRYRISRQKGLLDNLVNAASPEGGNFRYGLDRWIAEPTKLLRGEDLKKALEKTSTFRDIIDQLDPKTTAVTFWVYPDSFPLYRELRDYCVKKDILVAGRPLPFQMPIASSREGSASIGQ